MLSNSLVEPSKRTIKRAGRERLVAGARVPVVGSEGSIFGPFGTEKLGLVGFTNGLRRQSSLLARVWFSLCILVLAPGVSGSVHAENEGQQKQQVTTATFENIDWKGYNLARKLPDDTLLHSYVAETNVHPDLEDRLPAQITFRIQYFPRFDCSPLIGLYTSAVDKDSVSRFSDAFSSLVANIDGEPLDFPVLVEYRDEVLSAYYDANLQRRITFRILTDIGSYLNITFKPGDTVTFSLLGSRDAVTAARNRCKAHG